MSSPAQSGSSGRPANQRGAARLAAVQALYQMDLGGATLPEVLAEFETYRLGKEIDGEQYRDADAAFFRDIVAGVVRDQRTLDPAIDAALTAGWPLRAHRRDASRDPALAARSSWPARRDVPAASSSANMSMSPSAFFEGDVPRHGQRRPRRARPMHCGRRVPGPDRYGPERWPARSAGPASSN